MNKQMVEEVIIKLRNVSKQRKLFSEKLDLNWYISDALHYIAKELKTKLMYIC